MAGSWEREPAHAPGAPHPRSHGGVLTTKHRYFLLRPPSLLCPRNPETRLEQTEGLGMHLTDRPY